MRIKKLVLKGSGEKILIPEDAVVEVVIREVQKYVPILNNELTSQEEKGFNIEIIGYRPYLSITTKQTVVEILEDEIAVIVRENEMEEDII